MYKIDRRGPGVVQKSYTRTDPMSQNDPTKSDKTYYFFKTLDFTPDLGFSSKSSSSLI